MYCYSYNGKLFISLYRNWYANLCSAKKSLDELKSEHSSDFDDEDVKRLVENNQWQSTQE